MQKGPEPVDLLERRFRPDTIFTRVQQQTFGYEGGKYISEVDKYELIIPERAIPKSTHITVEFGVSPYGPFGPLSIHMVASQFLLLCGFAQIQQSNSSSQLKSNCHTLQIAWTKMTAKHSHSSKLITTRSLMKYFISVKLKGSHLLL